MGSALKFGLFVPQGWKLDLTDIADPVAQFEAMTTVAQAADQGGWDSIWVYDHFHTVPTPELETTFECWTSSATLARDTTRVKIGQMVGCNGYRNPALYAKIASTVDVASHGRLLAGIGAGWYEHEWRAYGYPWWETKERMARFREAVETIHRLWTEDTPVFHGAYYTIDGAINEPKGAGRAHPPLWIGGEGEQVTLKLVAQWGDGCNVGGGDPDVCRHKLEVLTRHCDRLRRNDAEITKSTSIEPLVLLEHEADAERVTAPLRGDTSLAEFRTQAWVGTTDQITERLHGLVNVGIDYVIVYLPRVAYDHEPLHRFTQEVIPRFT
jgi:F420-dependent oxidoreductase-like protein